MADVEVRRDVEEQRMSEEEFMNLVERWATKIGAQYTAIQFKPLKKAWGQCAPEKGVITFSTDLLEQPEDWINAVIVHELLHLTFPNHGKLFNLAWQNYLKNGLD